MPRLYDDLAHLWPLMSPPSDYVAEAALIRGIVCEHVGESGEGQRPAVLELGAGGGHTLVHLVDTFDAVAVDLSEPMLANCRALVPQAEAIVGDMRTVRLGRTFDAVLIHDAIDYMLTRDDLVSALKTAAAHLRPGGVVLASPTYVTETFLDHEVEHDHHADDEREVTYVSYSHDPDPSDTTIESVIVFFIREGGKLHVETDRHTCGLFSTAQWHEALANAGFEVETVHELPAAEAPMLLFRGVRR